MSETLILSKFKVEFKKLLNQLSEVIQEINLKNGWDINKEAEGTAIALMHSELSECLEWIRNGNKESNHIKGFSGKEEELADVIIRVLDFSKAKNLNTIDALFAKLEFNNTRKFKHGGKKF